MVFWITVFVADRFQLQVSLSHVTLETPHIAVNHCNPIEITTLVRSGRQNNNNGTESVSVQHDKLSSC